MGKPLFPCPYLMYKRMEEAVEGIIGDIKTELFSNPSNGISSTRNLIFASDLLYAFEQNLRDFCPDESLYRSRIYSFVKTMSEIIYKTVQALKNSDLKFTCCYNVNFFCSIVTDIVYESLMCDLCCELEHDKDFCGNNDCCTITRLCDLENDNLLRFYLDDCYNHPNIYGTPRMLRYLSCKNNRKPIP